MKRVFALFLMLILIFSLFACDNSQLPDGGNKQSQSEDNQQTHNKEICEHIWDDGIEVASGTGAYLMEYTCIACGKKKQDIITIIPSYPITEDDIINKVYVYEKDGFGSKFEIEIKADGTFTYYEGLLSSHRGIGEWSYSDGMLTLFEEMFRLNEADEWEQVTYSYSFWVEKDTLIFVDKGLDNSLGNFLYIKVKGGEKFFAK